MRTTLYIVLSVMCLWPLGLQAADNLEAPIVATPPPAKSKSLQTDGMVGPKTQKAVEPSTIKKVPPGAVSPLPKRQLGPSGQPDLIITRFEYVSDEFRFHVKNLGPGEKKPGKVYYFLSLQYFDPSGRETGIKNYSGVAGLTSLARLRPMQVTGEDRVTGHKIPIGGNMRMTMCINSDQRIAETNFTNNCMTRVSQNMLSDLELVSAKFELYRRVVKKKSKPWYKKVGDFVWDLVTVEFDESGVPYDYVKVTIRNNGGMPVKNFDISVALWKQGRSGQTYKTTHTEFLKPGQTRTATVYVKTDKSYWGDPACCQGTAMVDSTRKVAETNESNNKKSVTMRRIRDHRSGK